MPPRIQTPPPRGHSTLQQLAARWGVTVKTVHSWTVKRKLLPFRRYCGRRVAVPDSAVAEFESRHGLGEA